MDYPPPATAPFFRLLVAATSSTIPSAESIELGGKFWHLVWFVQISDAPPFTCVSYSWGPNKVANPFKQDEEISPRTIPVLETAIRASESVPCWREALAGLWHDEPMHSEKLALALRAAQALWIDSICMPSEPAAWQTCLLGMGAIYRAATQVIAVLAADSASTLKKIRDKTPLEHDDLLAIERDDWISRVWTYQEIATSQTIYFAAEADGTMLLNHQQFLNALVSASADYADAKEMIRNQLVALFPRLDSLQDVFTELQNVEYSGRSAFQILGAMQKRVAENPLDRIYAILGVVATSAAPGALATGVSVGEYFMQVCEQAGDFSYLFSTGPRSQLPGRSWRPTGEQFNAVVCGLAAFGFGLAASLKPTHLEMHNMCRMNCHVNNPVINALAAFMGRSFAGEILEHLRRRGFTGHGDVIKLEQGYFFPQLPLLTGKAATGLVVAVSQGVLFAQGGPGLLLRPVGSELNQFCDVGVFIGRVPGDGVPINVC